MNQNGIASSKSNCNAAMQDLYRVGGKLFILSVDSSLNFMRAVLNILTPTMSELKMPCFKGVCDIPETECPPRCVCRINWEACKGESRQHIIRITNTAKTVVTFGLAATPFSGPDGLSGLITLQPDSLVIKPGESGLSTASFIVPANAPSGEYSAEILVRGQYEQCILVTLIIRNVEQCVCDVSQGEIPVRIRAHHWYDHFQCVEPCFEPVQKDNITKPIGVAAAVKERKQ